MVAHVGHDVGHAELAVGNHPQGHILSIGVDAECPRQVAVEAPDMMVEETPHAGIADAPAREVGEGVGPLPREVLVLAVIPPHLARKLDGVLRTQHVVLVLSIEAADAALVGVRTDGIVGHAQRYPHHALLGLLAVGAAALHFQNPRLVGVADAEGLALAIVAVGFYQ